MKLQISPRLRSVLGSLAIVATISVLAGTYGIYRYGTMTSAFAALAGNHVAIPNAVQSLGDITVGESRVLNYSVTNLTGRSISVLGTRTSCKCTKLSSELTTLPASQTVTIAVLYTPIEAQAGRDYNGKVKLFVDDPSVRQLELFFKARVVSATNVARR